MKLLHALLCSLPLLPGPLTAAQAPLSAPAEPAPLCSGADHSTHEHGADVAANQPAWRIVMHYGCGVSAVYLVDVPAYNTLLCPGCGYFFTCFVR